MPRTAAALLLLVLLAGCSDPGPFDGDGEGNALPPPEAESGILRGTVTATEDTAEGTGAIAMAGHGRLAATLVLVDNLPETEISLNVSGPDGQSTEVDTGPLLVAFPGTRPTVSFEAPAAGDWAIVVRLESGASADYEVHWCADDEETPGPQDNLACHRDY